MGQKGPSDSPPGEPSSGVVEMTLEQLRGMQYGVGATIVPVRDGWRVHYFSTPDFEEAPGTTFGNYGEAMAAIDEVLTAVNTPEERARARDELHERIRRSPGQPA